MELETRANLSADELDDLSLYGNGKMLRSAIAAIGREQGAAIG